MGDMAQGQYDELTRAMMPGLAGMGMGALGALIMGPGQRRRARRRRGQLRGQLAQYGQQQQADLDELVRSYGQRAMSGAAQTAMAPGVFDPSRIARLQSGAAGQTAAFAAQRQAEHDERMRQMRMMIEQLNMSRLQGEQSMFRSVGDLLR